MLYCPVLLTELLAATNLENNSDLEDDANSLTTSEWCLLLQAILASFVYHDSPHPSSTPNKPGYATPARRETIKGPELELNFDCKKSSSMRSRQETSVKERPA